MIKIMSIPQKSRNILLLLFCISLSLGLHACVDYEEINRKEEAELRALARQKRRAWLEKARADVVVSLGKTSKVNNTNYIDINYKITNAGDRAFCHVGIGVSTLWYKDQVRGGVMNFNQCLWPGRSSEGVGRVFGYTVLSHSINDVTYIDDCRKKTNWDLLSVDRDCALIHAHEFHW